MLLPNDPQQAQIGQEIAEEFVQAALDALSAHIAILDETGTIIAVNAAWREFADQNNFTNGNYGIGLNYLAVCDTSSSLNSPDARLVGKGIREVMAGIRDEYILEYPCHGPYERRWFVVRVSRFDWYDQQRIIVAHQNVTELKRIQLQLEESNQRLEAILNAVSNIIITLDTNGTIVTANRAMMSIFGYESEDEVLGKPLNALLVEPLDLGKGLLAFCDDHGHELIGMRSDGSTFPIHLTLNKLELNRERYYTCIIQDFTYRKQVEAEIIERERVQVALEKERELRVLKNRFLSMMGHELNTPLASIQLSYDMMKKYEHLSTEEEKEQALDNIQQQVGHLQEMIHDVMTLSRSEAEGLRFEPEDTDLITYCRNVVEEFQFTYHKTHQIEFCCDLRDIRAMLDRRMLRRVFTNLLSNAIKYSPEGGLVQFCIEVDDETQQALIRVIDSGIGIPQEDQKRLFEPFHRAGNANKLPGTGLGLPIAKQIVELHGGSIAFESKESEGSTFTLTLPILSSRS